MKQVIDIFNKNSTMKMLWFIISWNENKSEFLNQFHRINNQFKYNVYHAVFQNIYNIVVFKLYEILTWILEVVYGWYLTLP